MTEAAETQSTNKRKIGFAATPVEMARADHTGLGVERPDATMDPAKCPPTIEKVASWEAWPGDGFMQHISLGGHAVAYHGYPRATGDMDFFVDVSEENAPKLVTVLGQFGFASSGLTAITFAGPERSSGSRPIRLCRGWRNSERFESNDV